MRQLLITTAMGKRLIGKGMAAHPEVNAALESGTLVIIAGTTNGYVAEEILAELGQGDGFTRQGFRRGTTVAPGAKAPKYDFPGDVVIVQGEWQWGKTIDQVADDLGLGDVIVKGANAYDTRGQAAVQIGNPMGGTILDATRAAIGRRVQLIHPVGLEKRVSEDVNDLAAWVNGPEGHGPRLFPMLGEVVTELDAIEMLTGATAVLVAGGGIYGAEGSYWLGIDGSDEQIDAAVELLASVRDEPPCEV
jgi:hypothetical protein